MTLVETKLHAPRARREWVARSALIDRLVRATDAAVVLVSAPAGYGKTTLLAQWCAARDERRSFAWVTLDPADDDPSRLWSHVVHALARALPEVEGRLTKLVERSVDVEGVVVPEIVNTLSDAHRDVVLVLDDFHFLSDGRSRGQVELLLRNLPPTLDLVISSRVDPAMHLGRLRVSGELVEVHADDLRFSSAEVASLVGQHAVSLSVAAQERLMARTEGWPAALYLAVLSVAGRPDAEDYVDDAISQNRHIGDYLMEEVIDSQPDTVRSFIYGAALFDRFNADLCDAVLERQDSASVLDQLERSNLFLIPLTGSGAWFRFHTLFGSVARARAAVAEPERAARVHQLAVEWFDGQQLVDEAVTHALALGDVDQVLALVQEHGTPYLAEGRTRAVLGWLLALGRPTLDSDPWAGLVTAWVAAIVGDLTVLEERLHVLERFADIGPLPDGSPSVEFATNLLRALFGFEGPTAMLAAAQRAVDLSPEPDSSWSATAAFAKGQALHVLGEDDAAGQLLEVAAARADLYPAIHLGVAALRATMALDARRLEEAQSLAERAMQITADAGLTQAPVAAPAYTALGAVRAESGQLDEAVALLEHGYALQHKFPRQSPWQRVRHDLAMAPVLVSVGRTAGAHELLAEAATVLDRWPDQPTALRARLAEVESAVSVLAQSPPHAVPEPLSERETAVLRLLQSDLSLREIAGQLYVAHSTVRTHVRMIYRKLDVSSRREAVEEARRRRLL